MPKIFAISSVLVFLAAIPCMIFGIKNMIAQEWTIGLFLVLLSISFIGLSVFWMMVCFHIKKKDARAL